MREISLPLLRRLLPTTRRNPVLRRPGHEETMREASATSGRTAENPSDQDRDRVLPRNRPVCPPVTARLRRHLRTTRIDARTSMKRLRASALLRAVAVGFEPTEGLHPHTLSRRAPSAARTRHREGGYRTSDADAESVSRTAVRIPSPAGRRRTITVLAGQ
jgi:hypothetical protein